MTNFAKRNEDLFRVLAAFIAAQLLGAVLMYLLAGFGSGYAYNLTINIICVLGVNAVVFLLFCGGVKLPEKADSYSRTEPVAFLFAAVFLSCMAGMLAKLLSGSGGGSASLGGAELVMYVVYTVLLAPITEEIAFRGAVLTALSQRGRLVSAAISAALFAAYHMSLAQLPYTFVLGVFLALLARRSGSLLPCILVHMANNLLTVAVGLYQPLGRVVDIALPILGTISLLWLIFTRRLISAK